MDEWRQAGGNKLYPGAWQKAQPTQQAKEPSGG